jgi:hypothetical protein
LNFVLVAEVITRGEVKWAPWPVEVNTTVSSGHGCLLEVFGS